MTALVLDLELSEATHDRTGCGPYPRALVLLRDRGRPVGQVAVPLVDGRLAGATLVAAIPAEVWQRVAVARAEEALAEAGEAAGLSITAAICTRERPDDLARALPALVAAAGAVP